MDCIRPNYEHVATAEQQQPHRHLLRAMSNRGTSHVKKYKFCYQIREWCLVSPYFSSFDFLRIVRQIEKH